MTFKMFKFVILVIFINSCFLNYISTSIVTSADNPMPCPFNTNCNCTASMVSAGKYWWTATCSNLMSFPVFSSYNFAGGILSLRCSGKFTDIPANAIYPLIGESAISFLVDGINVDQSRPLMINPGAFNSSSAIQYRLLELKNVYLPNLTNAFSNMNIYEFYVDGGAIVPSLSDYTFSGSFVSKMIMSNVKMQTVKSNAFAGMVGVVSSVDLSNNNLKEVSPAFKTLKTLYLELGANDISQVPDYAFCPCNTTGQCSSIYEQIYLTGNPITSLSDNAFANLPGLTTLVLNGCSLTSVPVQSLNQIPSLLYLDIGRNKITSVGDNSFYKLSALTMLYLDNNPITTFSEGAFNGLVSMETFGLQSLPITIFDLNVIDSMTSLSVFTLEYCSNLPIVSLSDGTKLPTTLKTVDLHTSNNITSVSPEFKNWLLRETTNVLDIQYNFFFTCDASIGWMSKFALCQPQQIYVSGTTCLGTKQPLGIYLQSFKPVCS